MAWTFFLRRTVAAGGAIQYYWLPAQFLTPVIENRVIAPVIPGSTSSNLAGASSPNFLLNLGSMQLRFIIVGTILKLTNTEVPGVSPDTHVLSGAASYGTQEADVVRAGLYDYIADQSSSTYNKWEFGYPDWGSGEVSVAGSNYRIFEGFVTNFTSDEEAGITNQFPYTMTFTVGDT